MNNKVIFCLVVMALLRDKDNPSKIYQPGENLQTDDLKRVNDLVGRKLAVLKDVLVPQQEDTGLSDDNVKVGESEYHYEAVKKALEAIGVKIASNAKVNGVNKVVESITDEQKASLVEELSKS